MDEASATPKSSEIQIYNRDVATTPFIKIVIPAAAVTAATLAGSLAYTATNTSVSALSLATEIGINGAGFVIGKAAGAFVSPIVGTSISVGSGFAATAAKEAIQTKGKLLSIATGSVAGAGAAIAVTAGSYLFSGLYSIGEAVTNKLHIWARASQYTDTNAQQQQEEIMWGLNTDGGIRSPTEEIEVIDELLPSPSSDQQNDDELFMKQVEKVALSEEIQKNM
jgi:hypothetical protein